MPHPAAHRSAFVFIFLSVGIASSAIGAIPYIDQEKLTKAASDYANDNNWNATCRQYEKLEFSTDRFNALSPNISGRMRSTVNAFPGGSDGLGKSMLNHMDKNQSGRACAEMYLMSMAMVDVGQRSAALTMLDAEKSAFTQLGYPFRVMTDQAPAPVAQAGQAWRLPPSFPKPSTTPAASPTTSAPATSRPLAPAPASAASPSVTVNSAPVQASRDRGPVVAAQNVPSELLRKFECRVSSFAGGTSLSSIGLMELTSSSTYKQFAPNGNAAPVTGSYHMEPYKKDGYYAKLIFTSGIFANHYAYAYKEGADHKIFWPAFESEPAWDAGNTVCYPKS